MQSGGNRQRRGSLHEDDRQEPTGRKIALDGIDHFVVRDGAVATNFVGFDQMQFARQTGMLPPDGSRADRAMKTAFNARSRLTARLRRI